jgi:COP9 signalosome complex subunit 7
MELFNRGSFATYRNNLDFYIPLTANMLRKLKILTLMDIAKDKKYFTFEEVFSLIDISEPFEFDQLVFHAFTSELIKCRINQKERIFEIISVKGRDTISDSSEYLNRISKWIKNIEDSEKYIDDKIDLLRKETKTYSENMISTFK